MNTIAFLVHGFNVLDGGRSSIGRLRPFLNVRGVITIELMYGWLGIGGTYTRNRSIAEQLAIACYNAKLADPHARVVVIGHSNGCTITHRAARQFNAPIDTAVYLNPALEKDVQIPDSLGRLDVWHSPSDVPVKWAKWLPLHPWGEMGRTGYEGHDKRVRNFNKEQGYLVSSSSHSDVFDPEKLVYFAPKIIEHALY